MALAGRRRQLADSLSGGEQQMCAMARAPWWLSVADRGYVMETGEIVREGTAGQLKDGPEVQRAYLGEIS